MTRHAALAALLLAACSGEGAPPDIRAAGGWARATAPGQASSAAYLTIENRGRGNDRLVGVATSAANNAALHQTSSSGGVARMRPLPEGIELPAGKTVQLQPQGAHIMLTGLARPLAAGQAIALDLRFERSGVRRLPVRIVPAAAEGMEGMAH